MPLKSETLRLIRSSRLSSGFRRSPRRDTDDVCIRRQLRPAGGEDLIADQCRPVEQIQTLPFDKVFVDVDQRDLINDPAVLE